MAARGGNSDSFLVQPDLNPPCDVTLVVEDGKEFKADRHVLSKACPFFEKLLNSDMKENKEGVIRLEIFTASQMTDVLEFIYTGKVKILTQENVEKENVFKLRAAADYLCLSNLKNIASKFIEQNLTIFDCLSTLNLAEIYMCDELISNIRKFIYSNFGSVAETEWFMNLPSHEVEKWISSDDIVINAEKDVFKIILRWIDHDRKQRSEKLSELFRHVRLTSVSRKFLESDIMTNDLVKKNKYCLDALDKAFAWIEQADGGDVPRPYYPRKAHETCAITFSVARDNRPCAVYFYVPERDAFYRLPETSDAERPRNYIFTCCGKLFCVSESSGYISRPQCYVPESNCWSPVPWSISAFQQELISSGQRLTEVLVISSKIYFIVEGNYIHSISSMSKYDLDASQWTIKVDMGKEVQYPTLAKGLGCLVAAGKFLYTIGGCIDIPRYSDDLETLSHCARFDTEENKWQDIADLQEARCGAFGVGTDENIFIVGGSRAGQKLRTCEVYNSNTDEWHVIASQLTSFDVWSGRVVLVNDTLHLLGCTTYWSEEELIVQYYGNEKDEWNGKTSIPVGKGLAPYRIWGASSLQILKEALNNLELITLFQ